MQSDQPRGVGAGATFAVAGVALACLLAGCGGAGRHADGDAADAATARRIAGLRFPKVTLTLEEIGETYSEEAWAMIRQPFEPFYKEITEADAFQWEYLRELEQMRREGLRRAKKRLALELKTIVKREKERKRREKAEAKAEAAAERKRAIEKLAPREEIPPTRLPPAPGK